MTTPFVDKPTLAGDLVTLRPIQAGNADATGHLTREEHEIARLTGSIRSSTEEAQAMSLDELREIYGAWATATVHLGLGVIDNASGDLVGQIVLNDWDEGNRFCAFRTLIGDVARGRGLGTEATRLIIQYGLGPMGLHRITLEVYDFNPRARHVTKRWALSTKAPDVRHYCSTAS